MIETTGSAASVAPAGQPLAGDRSLPPSIRGFWIAFVCLSAVAWAVAMYFRFARHIPHYPFGNPIFLHPSSDLTAAQLQFQHFHQPSFWSPRRLPLVYPTPLLVYPAPLALVYWFVFSSTSHPVLAFRAFIFLAMALAGYGFLRALTRRGIRPAEAFAFTLSALVLSYPFQMEAWLLNLEIIVWVALAVGIWAYATERSSLAAVCFGLAGAMKFFPLIYLGLPLARRQYRQTLAGALVFCAALPLCTWILGPTFSAAVHGQAAGLAFFKHSYILSFNRADNGINHSLFGVLKLLFAATGLWPYIAIAYRAYLLLFALLGTALYFGRIRHLPRINQVLLLSVASVMLPPISHDYTLMHLYAPLVLVILYVVEHRPRPSRSLIAMLGCFAYLCAGQAYLEVHAVSISGQIKALVLLALFLLALRYPLSPAETSGATA